MTAIQTVETSPPSASWRIPPAEGAARAHAVVIGSGFGGLAAAIRLGARGYRVTVLERLDRAGGRAYVHEQDGFFFDAGPTIVTAPFLLDELWALVGERFADDVQLRPMDPFYRIRFHDGETFDYSGDPEKVRKEIARFSPEDVAGYDRYMTASESIYRIGFEQLGHVPFGSWVDMAKILPSMLRLNSHRSVYAMVSKYIRDPRIRQVLSFHPLLVGGNPFATSSIYSLISFLERSWGVHSAMGGTGAIVQGMTRLIEKQGHQIRLGAEVEEILVEEGRACGVRLSDGSRIPADIVVSNADVAYTYRNLVPARYRRVWTDRRVARARYSNGLFVWYFGTARQYPEVPHHTIMLGPRYRGLIQDIFQQKDLSPDFSLYLHRPTATDPSLAPEGCDAFYVLSPVPHLGADIDWSERAEPYRQAIAEHLAQTVLPNLESAVITSRISTPLDFERQLLSYMGAGFSLEPTLLQSAWFRPHNASEDVDGLYIVGAGTHPGAGLPGVLSSAKVLDRVVPDPQAPVARDAVDI